MTEFSIYQINVDRDTANVCFIGMESLEKIKGTKDVNAAAYDRVYDGKMDCISLENIYQKFNVDHPADYKGRSLSVSDVVEIRESDTLNPGFYFVDSIGFKSISFDKSLCKEPVEAGSGKISALLVEPNKYPKMIDIDDTLEAMQEVVGGDIEEYMPFEDEVAIICNEEGKVNGLTPNRAVYGEPQAVEMTFAEMRSRFCEAENEGKEHLSGYIVFTQDSFDKPYDERSRTYGVSSNNKAFQAGMGGYSIFGSCLDGTDPCVRLDGYMFGENAWKIEKCYMMEPSREMLDIICGKFFIAYRKNIRLARLGDEYSLDRIKERIYDNRNSARLEPFQKGYYHRPRQYVLLTREHKIRKVGGLYGLYLHYCYKLGYLPRYKKQDPARLHYLLREDLMKLDEITAQVRLLGRENISTAEQLFSYQHSVEEQINALTADRTHLRNEIRKVNITDAELSQAKGSISLLSEKLKKLRKEVRLCNGIAERSGIMAENLRAVLADEEKIKTNRKENRSYEQRR